MLRNLFKQTSKEIIDINMLLSMSKLAGSSQQMEHRQQSPQDCLGMMSEIRDVFPDARLRFNFIYTDTLYLNRAGEASKLAEKSVLQMARHQEGFRKLSKEDIGFTTWNQTLIETNSGKVESILGAIRKKYEKDSAFAEHVKADTLAAKRGEIPDHHDIEFILQELVVLEMVRRHETGADRIIISYPGPPLKSDIYLRDENRPHPLGKVQPVAHKASWIDTASSKTLQCHEFPMPQKEKSRPSINPVPWGAGLAACFAAGALGLYVLPSQNHSVDEPVISLQKDGILTMTYKDKTVFFPDRTHLHHQIVFQDGRENPVDNRDEGQLAYEREIAVERFLELKKS